MISRVELLPVETYYETLHHDIMQAKKRIVIHAQTVLWEPKTEPFLPLLKQAAARGVEVRVIGDIYSKKDARERKRTGGVRMPPWRHTVDCNERLRAAGAHVHYIGGLSLNPYKGRCHTKAVIIDDHVFTFGGANFSQATFMMTDYVLRCAGKVFADYMYKLVRDIEQHSSEPLPDRREPVGRWGDLLLDGGAPGVSPIYDAACDIVKQASRVFFVSQMMPSGRLAGLLKRTDYHCYVTRAAQATMPGSLALRLDKVRYRLLNSYERTSYIHAKFILTEQTDGTRRLLAGSNNFSWRGVAFGTKELALVSADPTLWQAFYEFLQTTIA